MLNHPSKRTLRWREQPIRIPSHPPILTYRLIRSVKLQKIQLKWHHQNETLLRAVRCTMINRSCKDDNQPSTWQSSLELPKALTSRTCCDNNSSLKAWRSKYQKTWKLLEWALRMKQAFHKSTQTPSFALPRLKCLTTAWVCLMQKERQINFSSKIRLSRDSYPKRSWSKNQRRHKLLRVR